MSLASLRLAVQGSPKLGPGDIQAGQQLLDYRERRPARRSLDPAHVGPVDVGLGREFLLGHPALLPEANQNGGEHLVISAQMSWHAHGNNDPR